MLVLTRKTGEGIMIGDDVNVCVIGVRDGHAKIGISAPREIPIHRKEIYLRIQQENESKLKEES